MLTGVLGTGLFAAGSRRVLEYPGQRVVQEVKGVRTIAFIRRGYLRFLIDPLIFGMGKIDMTILAILCS